VRLRDELLEAIAREQALITRLEREREQALARVRSLQVELDVPVGDPDQTASRSPGTYPSLTAAEKIALFRSLFRGRGEVFPKLWVNPRSGRKGYAPACETSGCVASARSHGSSVASVRIRRSSR